MAKGNDKLAAMLGERLELTQRAMTAIGGEIYPAGGRRLPNGNWSIPVSQEVLDRINALRRPGETDDQVVARLIDSGARPAGHTALGGGVRGVEDGDFRYAHKARTGSSLGDGIVPALEDVLLDRKLARRADIREELDAFDDLAAIDKGTPVFDKTYRVDVRAQKKKPFATLFEAFRAALAVTDLMRGYYPLDVLEPHMRRHFDRECRELLPAMHRAHRIVLGDDFAKLAATMLLTSPRHLVTALASARMPYDEVWIEWDDRARIAVLNPAHASEAEPRAGFLIRPVNEEARLVGLYQATLVAGEGGGAVPATVGFDFCLNQPFPVEDIQRRANLFEVLGPATRHLLREAPVGPLFDVLRQASHVAALNAHALYLPTRPLGLMLWATMREAAAAGERTIYERQSEWLRKSAVSAGGLFCWVVAVLALLAYRPDRPDIVRTPAKGLGGIARGRILPGYNYQVVTLARPMTQRQVFTGLQREYAHPGPRAQHDVEAAWHYRHGRGDPHCEHAWEVRIDEDGNALGHDQQVCPKCNRFRWRVGSHKRGDPRYGIIEKGQRIVAGLPAKGDGDAAANERG